MSEKPVLLGMNNPQSENPLKALYPHPENSTGWRLWAMLSEQTGSTKEEYIGAFDRRNLVDLKTWSPGLAHIMAPDVWRRLEGRTVVILGAETLSILQREAWRVSPAVADRPEELLWQESHGARWCWAPHPSGKNLWYNDPLHRLAVAARLASLYSQGRGAVG